MISFLKKVFKDIETDIGRCPECNEMWYFIHCHDYYKCTNCGEEIKQYVNGHIKIFSHD
ncbi:MAG: hypothetical protein CM15mV134_210 [uncultured marine virus]|nr:MAG: hypothetical protein CM15mV134_210 [uncultured marine virus]